MSNAAMQSITDICGVEVASATSTPRKKPCRQCHSQGSCLSCAAGEAMRNELVALRKEVKELRAKCAEAVSK